MSKKEGNNKVNVNTAQGLEKKLRELHVAKLPVAMTQWPFVFLSFIFLLFYFILIYFTYFLCYCCFI